MQYFVLDMIHHHAFYFILARVAPGGLTAEREEEKERLINLEGEEERI